MQWVFWVFNLSEYRAKLTGKLTLKTNLLSDVWRPLIFGHCFFCIHVSVVCGFFACKLAANLTVYHTTVVFAVNVLLFYPNVLEYCLLLLVAECIILNLLTGIQLIEEMVYKCILFMQTVTSPVLLHPFVIWCCADVGVIIIIFFLIFTLGRCPRGRKKINS